MLFLSFGSLATADSPAKQNLYKVFGSPDVPGK
jgi:hypothetical protein